MSDKEEWRIIEDYPNYMVSSSGRVKSISRIDKSSKKRKEKMMKLTVNRCGYVTVSLINGNRKTVTVHRLVAKAFIPNENSLEYVNHKNEIKTDNRVENLEWISFKDNCNYGTRNERMKAKMINHDKKSKPVLQYTEDGELVKEWPSINEINRQLGFSRSHLSECCNNRRKTWRGYIWRFAS